MLSHIYREEADAAAAQECEAQVSGSLQLGVLEISAFSPSGYLSAMYPSVVLYQHLKVSG